jgi:predicted DCC family thiol-disulfide oxidoreductase YuxK
MNDITLLYDGACPICVREMARLAARDRANRLGFIDIAQADFEAYAYGTTLHAMLTQVHGVDSKGRLLIGIDCIAVAYTAVGLGWLVWPLKIELTKPIWSRLYQWFARNRYRVSRFMGIGCANGVCGLPRRGVF